MRLKTQGLALKHQGLKLKEFLKILSRLEIRVTGDILLTYRLAISTQGINKDEWLYELEEGGRRKKIEGNVVNFQLPRNPYLRFKTDPNKAFVGELGSRLEIYLSNIEFKYNQQKKVLTIYLDYSPPKTEVVEGRNASYVRSLCLIAGDKKGGLLTEEHKFPVDGGIQPDVISADLFPVGSDGKYDPAKDYIESEDPRFTPRLFQLRGISELPKDESIRNLYIEIDGDPQRRIHLPEDLDWSGDGVAYKITEDDAGSTTSWRKLLAAIRPSANEELLFMRGVLDDVTGKYELQIALRKKAEEA